MEYRHKVRTLKQTYGNTKKDKIKNKIIHEKVEIAPKINYEKDDLDNLGMYNIEKGMY